LVDSVGSLTVDEPRVKSKNLNVVDEYEKSGMKRMANFVVVGKFDASCIRWVVRRSNYDIQAMWITARARSWAVCCSTSK
jgi:hypothetical protein